MNISASANEHMFPQTIIILAYSCSRFSPLTPQAFQRNSVASQRRFSDHQPSAGHFNLELSPLNLELGSLVAHHS